MTYTVRVERQAQKVIAKLPQKMQRRVLSAIGSLASEPRPVGSKKLVGQETWRIRVGDYRVVYTIKDAELLVVVVKVGHRSKVYEG